MEDQAIIEKSCVSGTDILLNRLTKYEEETAESWGAQHGPLLCPSRDSALGGNVAVLGDGSCKY